MVRCLEHGTCEGESVWLGTERRGFVTVDIVAWIDGVVYGSAWQTLTPTLTLIQTQIQNQADTDTETNANMNQSSVTFIWNLNRKFLLSTLHAFFSPSLLFDQASTCDKRIPPPPSKLN